MSQDMMLLHTAQGRQHYSCYEILEIGTSTGPRRVEYNGNLRVDVRFG